MGTAWLSEEDMTYQRLTSYHRDRVEALAEGAPPLSKRDGGIFIVHLIPQECVVGLNRFPASELRTHGSSIPALGQRFGQPRFNCDGYLAHSGSEAVDAYSQLLRDGRLEAAMSDIIYETQNTQILRVPMCEAALFQVVSGYLGFCKAIGLGSPIWLFAALVNCTGVRVPDHPRGMSVSQAAIDRSPAFLPECQITSFEIDAIQFLRPLCDAIWQSAGVEKSLSYDNEGQWHERW